MSKGSQNLFKIVIVSLSFIIVASVLIYTSQLEVTNHREEYLASELEYKNWELVRQSEQVFEGVLNMNEELLADFTTLLESKDPELREQAFENIDLQWNISSIYYAFDFGSGNMYHIYPMRYNIFYANLKGIKNKIKMKENPTLTEVDRENLETAISYLSIFTEGMSEINKIKVRNGDQWKDEGLDRFHRDEEVMEVIEGMHESISELPPLLR
ncbi:hypothetical protein [Chengkuizengella axinellae]|uniref:Uncharacterized protein n=1 Tax=Chengkuizengella axinellae TaxID=3064388 RepID=A0ABT9J431_9BACL|nr:hypothetical protein [Chengkuizengella sp. 2205SS18-9]MDP5275745.1 hypothetical protein [Chengkuizengella sp. 2205SS18-9]